ncbi:DUF885 domain-containing protein [uncultured Paraglaciecola sp.]|uniref:DUF885 domain-containing protein n=1 Tax=uncultured Paraglaciecola sp. TaxID=1765024 RepID=UPI00259595A4|nr:DUF885 domain-containing protein [uncultured Paraglaciecola sp.]
MMTRLKFIPLSILTIAISACSPQPSEQTEKPIVQAEQNVLQTESEKLAQYFADMFEQDLKRSPITQSYLGYKWDYDKWNDISDAHQDETVAIQKARLDDLRKFDLSQLTEQEKLSIDVAITDIQRRLANDKFRDHTYIMHQFRAYHTIVPSFLINIHRIKSIDDAEAYVARLNNVKPLFTQVIQQLKKRQELGVFPPKWAYDQMIQASHNVISGNPFEESPENSTIWDDFTTKVDALGLTNMETVGLIAEARAAIEESVLPAYRELIDELKIQQKLTPEGDGVWRLPDGETWYKNRLEWFTTTDLNADQVHQIGLENVERIHNAMKAIKQEVGFEGDLAAFFEFMRTDEQFYYPATDEGRARYMEEAKTLIDTMEEKVPEYFGLTPKARMQVKRVEAFREKSAGKAFYQSPSKDGSRPGTYYANLYNMKDMPTYQMEALAYHEGIPGHHMQRSIAQELEGIPEFQKYVSFTAYTEGWGLYTEELAKDMGFYENPYSDFGRLAMELWRACRLVVDTGIHAKKWSRDQAIDYLIKNTPNPENDSVKAIERYIAMPGQATAYMIGKLKIMELRTKAKESLGDKFDIRGFHDEVLKDGPVPLNILESKINNWIEQQKNLI